MQAPIPVEHSHLQCFTLLKFRIGLGMSSAVLAVGHTDSVLCCELLGGKKLLSSGGEDGAICLTDLCTLKPVGKVEQTAGDAVPALCAHPAEEHTLFAAAGAAVLQLDLRKALGPAAVCRTFDVNQEEVNGLAVTPANGGWLAAGDDSGEIQVISLQPSSGGPAAAAAAAGPGAAAPQPAAAAARPAYKTLRRGHSNICSAVAFRPHRPWELLSGGLDSTVLKWDYSRLRPLQSWSLSGEATASGGQLFNPPMVHSIAVPQCEDRSLCRLMAVARGDGCISLYDADHKPPAPTAAGSGSSSSSSSGGKKGGSKARQRQRQRSAGAAAEPGPGSVPGRLALLGAEQGGHTAAVNSVSFCAGSNWQQLLSAGNDCRLLLWNWQAAAAAGQAAAEAAAEEAAQQDSEPSSSSLQEGGEPAAAPAETTTAAGAGGSSSEASPPLLAAEHRHPRKINFACSADVAGCGFNVFLVDTGRRVTALALARG